jgi:hypothetical protein
MEEPVRWTIKVSKETDLTLRTYLGSRGMKKGDLSKFVEEAVRWRVFNRSIQDIKARNADPDELQAVLADEGVVVDRQDTNRIGTGSHDLFAASFLENHDPRAAGGVA